MLQPLPPSQFPAIRPLFAPLDHYLTIDSILAGLSPGAVYADDARRPRTAVTGYSHRLFIAGAVDPALLPAVRRLILDVYRPAYRVQGKGAFILHAPPAWHEHVPALLDGWRPFLRRRRYYRLDAGGQEWSPSLPPGYTLRPVTAALLADEKVDNREWLTAEMESERPSAADFLAKSFGACVLHDAEIVGWCLSEYNTGHRCELGIATAEAHQRRGLATATGTAVIRHARRQGIDDIGWVCWGDNLPSVAAAQKLGFHQVADDPVWVVLDDHIQP